MPNWMETGKADDFTALMTMTQDMVSDQDHSPTFDELLTDFYRDLVSSRSSQVYAGKLSEVSTL